MLLGHLTYEPAEVTISKAREALGDTEVSNWPRYESHKIVQATPIVAIRTSSIEGRILFVQPHPDQPIERFEPTEPAMAARAEIDGYAVIYSDGFRSVSPKKAFEDGYTLVADDPA